MNCIHHSPVPEMIPFFPGPTLVHLQEFVIQTIHRLLLQAGIPTRGFSGHSLRKGAAVTAAANGMSRDEIKLLGRWKSDAVDVYINELSKPDITQKLLLLSSKLHTST